MSESFWTLCHSKQREVERDQSWSRTPSVLGDGADDSQRWTKLLGIIADSHMCGTSGGTAVKGLIIYGEERRKLYRSDTD